MYSGLVFDVSILDVDIMIMVHAYWFTAIYVGERLGLLNPVNVYPMSIRCLKCRTLRDS